MRFVNYIPRGNLPISREMSRLASPREHNSVQHVWRAVEKSNRRGDQLTNRLSQSNIALARAIASRGSSVAMHPFKIYQFPRSLRIYKNADDFQRWKVHGGRFEDFNRPLSPSTQPVKGTDRAGEYDATGLGFPYGLDSFSETYVDNYWFGDRPPTDDSTIADQWHETVVPNDGAIYFFWVSLCFGGNASLYGYPQLIFGTAPASSKSLADGTVGDDVWPNFPDNDPYHWLVGSVRYPTGSGQQFPPQVRQYLSTNIQSPVMGLVDNDSTFPACLPMRFRGSYLSDAWYWYGDVVRDDDNGHRLWIYSPVTPDDTSYPYWLGPISGVGPFSNHPDPWFQLGDAFTPL